MKFKLEETINDVVKFDVNHFGLHRLTKDMSVSGITGLNLNDENFFNTDKSIPWFFLNGDFLCVNDAYSRCIIFDLANDKKRIYSNTEDLENGFRILNEKTSNKRELLRLNSQAGEISASIWNVDTNKQQPTSQDFAYWYEDGRYIFYIHSGFSAISRLSPSDEVIWSHQSSFKETTRIRDVLGMYNGFLWLTNEADRIYSLDSETGEICHSLSGAGSTFKYMIEPEKNRLVALQDNKICIVDIGETKLTHHSVDTSKLFDVEIFSPSYFGMFSRLPIVDSHIVFSDVHNAGIGVFDIDNAQVTWQHKMYAADPPGTVKEMQYYDNKLYVRCSDNTLHLFNRVR